MPFDEENDDVVAQVETVESTAAAADAGLSTASAMKDRLITVGLVTSTVALAGRAKDVRMAFGIAKGLDVHSVTVAMTEFGLSRKRGPNNGSYYYAYRGQPVAVK